MKAISYQFAAFSKQVGTQNRTRENIMIRDNNSIVTPEKPQALSGIHRRYAAIAAVAALLAVPQTTLANPGGLCGAQVTDGLPATADTITCDPTESYPDGITYTSDGDLTLEVSPDAANSLNVEDDGIDVSAGNALDNLFWDSTGFTSGSISGSAGAVLDYSAIDGAIDIRTGATVSGSGNATHGIRATASGAGAIDITVGGFLFGHSEAAIEAVSGSGNITIDGPTLVSGGGIFAQTGGAGTIDITTGVPSNFSSHSIRVFDGVGIDAVAESGDITVNLNNRVEPAGSGVGIRTDTGGQSIINITEFGQIYSGLSGALDTIAVRGLGNSAVINVETRTSPLAPERFASNLVNGSDVFRLAGVVDFSQLTGGAQINIGGDSGWTLSHFTGGFGPTSRGNLGTSRFSLGDDAVNIAQGGFLSTTIGTNNSTPGIAVDLYEIDFGDGDDTLHNAGTVLLGPINIFSNGSPSRFRREGYEAELRIHGLETFVNAGSIFLGADLADPALPDGVAGFPTGATDVWPDDMLSLLGATYHGENGKIFLDINLNGTDQPGCDASLRDPDTGDLPVSDCIGLQGGAATGRTEIVLNEMVPGDRGAYNPNGSVIVDISGGDPGATDPDAFVMSPDSSRYNPGIGNGAIDKGLFFFTIAFDPATQQFKVYGLPSSGGQQLALLSQAANELWRTSANAWFGRQVDERDLDLASNGGGTWARVTANSGDRDLITPILAGSESLDFDNSYTQDSSAFTIGRDLIFRDGDNGAWLVGAMVGYNRARVDFDNYQSSANLEGMHAGLYGSLTRGAFYLDAVVNGSWVDVHNDVPVMELQPEGTELSTEVQSFGAQIEGGWRLTLGRFGIEPLASLSYVNSTTDDLRIPADDPSRLGGDVDFDDTVSFRGGLGARLSVTNVLPGIVPTDISLTARVVEEFDGDSKASIANVGPFDAPVADTFDGTFGQVTGSVSIHNTAKTVAGYLNVDGTFESDYESVGVEAGFRYQW